MTRNTAKMAEQVVIEFDVDASELNKAIDAMEALGKITKEDADKFRKANEDFKKTSEALKNTSSEAKKAADNVKNLGKEGKKAGEELSKGTQQASKSVSQLSANLKDIAKTIGIAFAVREVINFGKESVRAFLDAELNATRLKTAVGVNGGLQSDYIKLIEQSKKLKDTTIFSDDTIQNVQTAGLQFGLTAKQVEDLIPVITDFASATGQDLNSAMDSVLRSLEGNVRGLKLYGIEVDSTKTKTEILDQVTGQLNEKFKGQAQIIASTSIGELQKMGNAYDELRESIGGVIIAAGQGLAEALLFNFDKAKFAEVKGAQGLLEARRKQDQDAINYQASYGKAIEKLTKDQLEGRLELVLKLQQKASTEGNKKQVDDFNMQLEVIRGFIKEKELLEKQKELSPEVLAARKQAQEKALASIKQSAEEQRKAEREAFLEQQKQNKASSEESGKLQVLALQKQSQIEIQELNKLFLSKGDFSKDAEEQLADDLLKIKIKYFHELAKYYEDDKIKQAEIANEILSLENQLADNSIGIAKRKKDEKAELAEKEAKEIKEREEKLQRELIDIANAASGLFNQLSANFSAASARQIDEINSVLETQISAYDTELEANEERLNKKSISERDFRKTEADLLKKKQAAEEEAKRKEYEIRRKDAAIKKAASMFEIIINTASAIAEVSPVVPLMILAGLTGAAQLALVASTPVPKFAKGTLSVGGTGNEDTVHALLTPGEAVIPQRESKDYRPSLAAIYHRRIAPKDLNDLVEWKLKGGNTNVTASIDHDKLASAIVWQMNHYGKKGVHVTNWNDLASIVGGGGLYKRGV